MGKANKCSMNFPKTNSQIHTKQQLTFLLKVEPNENYTIPQEPSLSIPAIAISLCIMAPMQPNGHKVSNLKYMLTLVCSLLVAGFLFSIFFKRKFGKLLFRKKKNQLNLYHQENKIPKFLQFFLLKMQQDLLGKNIYQLVCTLTCSK